MHDRRTLTEDRLTRQLRDRIRPAVHPRRIPTRVEVACTPGEPPVVRAALAADDYQPHRAGDAWGAPWSTTWFHVRGTVPQDWSGHRVELVADLGFDRGSVGFQCEGLAYTPQGAPVKGLNPYSDWLPVTQSARGGESVEFYIEAAANLSAIGTPGDGFDFRPSTQGDPRTAGTDALYRTRAFDLVVVDETVWELVQDLEVLQELMTQLDLGDGRRWEILAAVERALDAVDPEDVGATARAARDRLKGVLSAPAHASAHRLSAVGHAHIDSAWLWPVRETVRKVARTCANVVDLLDHDEEFVFAMSQAQQFAWLKEHRPEVFARVREKVAEGRFVPVGGMWVEADTNLTGGEAMARQFSHGKRFFLEEFGVEPDEVWLPDSFGYSAALPQLMKLAGAQWFLTQKISWNTVNRFPHHTFFWEGIDGTRIFTHFPPADLYNAQVTGAEVHHAARNFAEKGHARHSLIPYGHGDGGGGPTREMLARIRRLRDLEGSPRVEFASPGAFHAAAKAEYAAPPVWTGELYLESHRGTYTSQARTKQGNRRCEHLLREAELWAATAAVRSDHPYPYAELDRLWKVVLLHQFHDILPGSSIAWVHREAEEAYAAAAQDLERIISEALGALTAGGDRLLTVNSAPHVRHGVPALAAGPAQDAEDTVDVRADGDGWLISNGALTVAVDHSGLLTSVHDLAARREVLVPGERANLLQLHRDLPNQWDAWDVDENYRNHTVELTDADDITVLGQGVRVTRRFGSSTVVQNIVLRPGARRVDFSVEVDWHERQKLLKVAFPLDVHADRSAAEIQFGHVFRPTHSNTTWDAAKFEIPAHRWVHVGEPAYGVAVVNEATYGHDITRVPRPAQGSATLIRLSLLRAPLSPDPEADQGRHVLRYALVPGADIGDSVREGYAANLPERFVTGRPVAPLIRVDSDAVVVESVKLADDRSGDIVVRLYEALGGRAVTALHCDAAVVHATEVDLMERPTADVSGPLHFHPFQIRTVRLHRA